MAESSWTVNIVRLVLCPCSGVKGAYGDATGDEAMAKYKAFTRQGSL